MNPLRRFWEFVYGRKCKRCGWRVYPGDFGGPAEDICIACRDEEMC